MKKLILMVLISLMSIGVFGGTAIIVQNVIVTENVEQLLEMGEVGNSGNKQYMFHYIAEKLAEGSAVLLYPGDRIEIISADSRLTFIRYKNKEYVTLTMLLYIMEN